MTESLKIFLWGEEIGRLSWDNRLKRSYFTFAPSFSKRGLDILPITAPIGGIRILRPLDSEDNKIYHKLPAFLADSLPDSWGNSLFERWCAENKIPVSDINPLDKLSFIGKRGMGALEFEPDTSPLITKEPLKVKALIDLARKIFTQRENMQILPDESMTLKSLVAVGTSAGGRQPKAIVAINDKTHEIRSGQLEGLENYDYCIIKFGDPQRSSAEIEMTYYDMATMAGIRMMDSSPFPIDGKKHFRTSRFDRIKGKKLYTQTLAAINPDADSYEKLLWTCRRLRLPEKDSEEAFRRMVFNILANNTDDHNKNFSFIMDTDGTWRLSPAYDMTFIFNEGGFQPENIRCLSVRGKLTDININDAYELAHNNGIRRPDSIIRKVATAISAFEELSKKNEVDDQWICRIKSCLSSHLADWGFPTTNRNHEKEYDIDGHHVSNVKISQEYKGNFKLNAIINGQPLRYVYRKETPQHKRILENGIFDLPDDILIDLLKKDLLRLESANLRKK